MQEVHLFSAAQMQVDPSSSAPADSWEDTADASSSSGDVAAAGVGRASNATTPDDGDVRLAGDDEEEEDSSMDTDGGGASRVHVPASKPKTKVKPKAEEATTTDKEHVNVVFIGHVGKFQKLKI